MTTIAILTSAFPFHPGEQFLEDESKFWSDELFDKVIVFPLRTKGVPRSTPSNVIIDRSLCNGNRFARLRFVVSALFSPLYYSEIRYLISARKLSLVNLGEALRELSGALQTARNLKAHIRRNGPVEIAYSYWNHYPAYAAALLKRQGLIGKVVSRMHGFDLYEERRSSGYMPLKRQFARDFDRLYAISQEGKAYFERKYNGGPVEVSRLGVPLPSILSRISSSGLLHIVSLSNCVPVKRIDRIIGALRLLARSHPELDITWTHLGGGPLLEELRELTTASFEGLENVRADFKGTLENVAVRRFFEMKSIDLFINTSESEGVPVSIMEAMSYGVPTVAPDVGGVSDLVGAETGWLLSADPDYAEIADAIAKSLGTNNKLHMRQAANERISKQFDSVHNYQTFWANLHRLAVN